MADVLCITIELSKQEVEFLLEEGVNTLFHCCGEGATTTEANEQLQIKLEGIITNAIGVV